MEEMNEKTLRSVCTGGVDLKSSKTEQEYFMVFCIDNAKSGKNRSLA